MIVTFKHVKDWGKYTQWHGALHAAAGNETDVRNAVQWAERHDLHLIVFYAVDLELRPLAEALVKDLK